MRSILQRPRGQSYSGLQLTPEISCEHLSYLPQEVDNVERARNYDHSKSTAVTENHYQKYTEVGEFLSQLNDFLPSQGARA